MLTIIICTIIISLLDKYFEISKIKAIVAGVAFGLSLAAIFSLFAPKKIYVQEAEYMLSFKNSTKMSGSFLTGFESKQYFTYHIINPNSQVILQKELENKYVFFYPYDTETPFMAHIGIRTMGIWRLLALPFDKNFCTQVYMPGQYIISGT